MMRILNQLQFPLNIFNLWFVDCVDPGPMNTETQLHDCAPNVVVRCELWSRERMAGWGGMLVDTHQFHRPGPQCTMEDVLGLLSTIAGSF